MSKSYGELLANDAIDLELWPAEVHGILGENGAGKTTLMRVLYGLSSPDAGEIRLHGHPIAINSPSDAIAAGIGMVTQHFSLVRPMSVAENVVLGRTAGVRVDLARARRDVAQAAARFGIRVDPQARVGDLSLGEQQRVEILKALYRECRVLILDEPTAVLVPQEVDALFATLRRLVGDGMAVVFISHKLNEVLAITDRVTILRRGRVVGSVRTANTSERELAGLMVGRPMTGVSRVDLDGPQAATRTAVLQVDRLSARDSRGVSALRDISLEVRAAEIVGVAGVSGNGQSQLVAALTGMLRPSAGSIRVAGHDVAGRTPTDVMAAGVGRIPEDRHAAVIADMSVAYNLALEHLNEYSPRGLVDEARIRREASALIDRFAIKARPDDRVGTLSGGNIQKVLLARVLAREPRVLIVSQPTRGLDVGATEYVRQTLLEQRASGAAILLVSEDLDELIALSDRLVVMYEGRIVGEVAVDEADPDRLGLLMAGHVSDGEPTAA
jgi:simple sugar transport system ATP-binding protein